MENNQSNSASRNNRPRIHLLSSARRNNNIVSEPNNDAHENVEMSRVEVFQPNNLVFKPNQHMMAISKIYSRFVKDNYNCEFCKLPGHHVGVCGEKKLQDKFFKKDPLLKKAWGEYKFSKINLEHKEQKAEYKRLEVEKKQRKFEKAQEKLVRASEERDAIRDTINQRKQVGQVFEITREELFAEYMVVSSASSDSNENSHLQENSNLSGIPGVVKVKRHIISAEDAEREIKCVICLRNFLEDQTATNIECNHYMHYDCMLAWFNSRRGENNPKSCPTCKRAIEIAD
jgi:hypothetical protein